MSVVTLFATFFVPTASLASENYLLDVMTGSFRSRGSCLRSEMEHEGAAFFAVNGLDLPTYTVPGQYVLFANGDDRNQFRAVFGSALLTPGANIIDFRIASAGDDQTCVDAVDLVTLSSPSFSSREIFSIVRRGFAFSGSTEVNFTLTELNPALAKSIATLLEFIRGYRTDLVANAGRAAQRDAEIAAQLDTLAKLERDLNALAEQGFDDIDAADLNTIFARYPNLPKDGQAALANLVEDLHKSVSDLRAEVSRVMDEFAAQADSVEDSVTRQARLAGWDPDNNDNYKSQVFGEQVPDVSTPDIGAVSVFDGFDDFYDRYATSIVADLSETIEGDKVADKEEFASVVAGWRKNQEAVERIIRERATVNLAESQAFVRAQNKVLAFVRRHMDEGDWFKDAPVSPELKRLLDGVIKQRFGTLAARIKSGMNSWTVLGTQQQMLGDMTLAAGSVLEDGYDAEPEEVKGVIPRILGWTATAVTVGISLTPIGDALDACQAITGQENCNPNGRVLEDWERVAAGLGVVIGSGKFWTAVGGVVGAKVVATKLSVFIASMQGIPIPQRLLLRARLGPSTLAHLADIAAPEVVELSARFGDVFITKFAKSVGGKGIRELRELRFLKLTDPAIATIAATKGQAVKSMRSMVGAPITDLRAELQRVGMTRLSSNLDASGQEIWYHATDHSIVRIAHNGTAFRPGPHFKMEIAKTPGSNYADSNIACKVTDTFGTAVPAGTNQSAEQFKQWFGRSIKDKVGYARDIAADELDDLLKIWGDATHVPITL